MPPIRPSGTNDAGAEVGIPTVRVQQSFLAAMDELRAEGRGDLADQTMIGSEVRDFGDSWSSPHGFAGFVEWLRGQALEGSPRPEGYVPSTTLWWVDGDEYLGRLAIRHRLTPRLRQVGGH